VLAKSTLPARERELAILRAGWRCGSAYEFGQHTVIAGRCGVTDDEIRALVRDDLAGWSDDDTVLLSAVGSLAASRNRSRGLPFWPALGFGMLYGAAVSVAVALLQGQSFALPAVASWWLSLFYLALAGSVLTFACFLTLQERIGPGPSATIGVMTPLLALLVSMAFEAFRPDGLTLIGAALAVAGNVLMLRRV
jgi:hypothetical protein